MLLVLLLGVACAVDPEASMTSAEIIQYWGYPVEIEHAVTEDGYILELHRIPYGRSGSSAKCRPVVFFQHGLLADSSMFLANPSNESGPFILADAGFDIWLGNFRGSTYSTNHTTLSTASPEFWNFTWDDMARKDLDAMISTVLSATGQDGLYYIGHSEGTMTIFSKLSYDEDFAGKIKLCFALGPIGTFNYIGGFLGFLSKYFAKIGAPLLSFFGDQSFLPNNFLTRLYAETVCTTNVGDDICAQLFLLIGGENTTQLNKSRTDVYNAHFPAGTSALNMAHFIQLTYTEGLVRFNYDLPAKNIAAYGTATPPSYNITAIKKDIYLFWSDQDELVTAEDVQYLITKLNPDYLKGNNNLPGYNHFDYAWGLNAPTEVYAPIIQTIKGNLGGAETCSN